MTRPIALVLALLLSSCGSSGAPPAEHATERTPQEEADLLLAFYDPILLALSTEASRAAWVASTDVSEEHTGARTGADTAFSAFAGNAEIIERARALLEHEAELDDITARQIHHMLELAAGAPMTNPELARARVAAESAQSARLDGYQFCLAREAGECTQPVTTNDIDRVLVESRDLDERLNAWRASKDVGPTLRDGLVELRGLRNGVAQEMGYQDFFQFQVSNYGMSTEEMMELLDRLVVETRPLFSQLHCWARYELAQRYGVTDVPRLIPAHWIGNRWGQSWPGLVDGVDMDSMMTGREPEWLVQQAERFYQSMGFTALPESFYENSDLYPVPEGQTRRKNAHASAWHIDLREDVRSLMSVESTWDWFTTTHHELGHIYYYISYSNPDVPPLLREGANRSYHEGMGDLIALAASQPPYLREIGLLSDEQDIDEVRWLLDSALTGPITFMPFAAGTMSHFERDLYAGELPADELNQRWWEIVGRYQGIAPPEDRPSNGCDACTKTHINDDPAQYYDYALANVLVYQLHDHICRNLLHQDPHACNYYNRPEVGEFLRTIMTPGATRDWRQVLRENTGRDLTAEPMLEYYAPLMTYLQQQNQGRDCSWPAEAGAPE
ncbi:MAG: M2 family metallopeptidase [Sandaracinaceae bacterium]|nr:M2 family metallopeptidase [Sandaracinaceae bacterium]